MHKSRYTAILEKAGDRYVARCPEFDVATQGTTVQEAVSNLGEAVELFLERADPAEIKRRLHGKIVVTGFEAVHAFAFFRAGGFAASGDNAASGKSADEEATS